MKRVIIGTFILLLFACNRVKVSPGTPKCIKNKIEDYIKTGEIDGLNVDAYLTVYEYEYSGKKVYLFKVNNPVVCGAPGCDPVFEGAECNYLLFDEDCNRLNINECTCDSCDNFSGKLIRKVWTNTD